MRSARAVLAAMLVIVMVLVEPTSDGEDAPFRDPSVDLYPIVNLPLPGGSYSSDHGFVANVTVRNGGSTNMTGSGTLNMVLRSFSSGEVVFSAISKTISGIPAGGSVDYNLQNWTDATPGKYICNVSVLYPPDEYQGNNFVETVFTLWTDYWPYPPRLDSWSVSPAKGNTTTTFLYKVTYIHNFLPMLLKAEIDGVNRTMVPSEADDDNPQDGKEYRLTTLLPIGNHQFRVFCEVNSTKTLKTEMVQGPWVNITLKNPYVYPDLGHVTSDFRFSVEYGSTKNLEPNELYLRVGERDFDMARVTPTPNYLKGDVRFETTVLGMELLPSPVSYSFHCRTQTDEYGLGPFLMEGPSMKTVMLVGTVKDMEGTPLTDAIVELDPGEWTTTGPDGTYALVSYIGYGFGVTYSKAGFMVKMYEIDLMTNRTLNIELQPIPTGGTVEGRISFMLDGVRLPVQGANVNISSPQRFTTTTTNLDGNYTFRDVTSGTSYTLTVSENRFVTHSEPIKVHNGRTTYANITLIERPMGVSVDPLPADGPLSVSSRIALAFTRAYMAGSVEVGLRNSSSAIGFDPIHNGNGTLLEVVPILPLNFAEPIHLSLSGTVLDVEGKPLVWRDISWDYTVEEQPQGQFRSEPAQDSTDVDLGSFIEFSFGIGLMRDGLNLSFRDLDLEKAVPLNGTEITDSVDWSMSGRTDTVVKVHPSSMEYSTRYSLDIDPGLKDIYGRPLLERVLSIEFTTVPEPDKDGDGHPDSLDAFKNDPSEWYDGDGDGRGDLLADRFPSDRNEWNDTDGDNTGDNSDLDDDNDGIPDEDEILWGLDPREPTDAFLDLDDDGYSNLREYLEGTDPTDPKDFPKEDTTDDASMYILIGLIVLILIVIAAGTMFAVLTVRGSHPHLGSEKIGEE